MIKKIVVLAAGRATRMKELAEKNPKHLIKINNEPFLYYFFKNIKKAGFAEIILVVGNFKEQMIEFAKKYEAEFNLTLIDQFKIIGTKKYGTACPVEAVENVVGKDNFIVVNGDDLFSVDDLKKIANIEDKFCYLAGIHNPEPEHYGILEYDENNFLKRVIEKPVPGIDFNQSRAMEYLISPGVYKFTPEIFKAVKRIKKSARGEYELTDAVNLLAQDKKVKIFPIQDYWQTFTSPDDVAKMEKFLLK
ncbi:hypothetical protein A3H03_02950 [Candidatus Kuenenbacteria bacterium RIFCSPLOWO2_12_FULL_42_13]|uniref:Nucleotidyl transferase n=4 Tax=Candidatus Kueneniibacteriota TaxID=1752740 RepID=A0A0G1B027_9BACT|nr:MAG: Nucleotidyl transferase [Candidatus Kuenenbacteria bacterium GW2011_GWA2_42_15]OGG89473.1 MAG: hypothetical protein A3C68_01905 [Candidatus Kuenenbacteria bacterium RIFCSPHIGHO2_02_FULL_42_29]OGG91126.1 MAG: hypothetical protein A3H55_02200 [Candidatus Kuenenbacteria bacterium RIFCSPLOWO2_02_FULL_42_16]OGG91625.1 MAG: hypothetical protein A3H03_02950 [Candidatus Kuenenbacteria bacterium RIFCSPLOWO2_12_FULL_42_13]OGG98645.1 MAG: hypothetical protein A3E04_01325 [Candidatus Kuenenbacteria